MQEDETLVVNGVIIKGDLSIDHSCGVSKLSISVDTKGHEKEYLLDLINNPQPYDEIEVLHHRMKTIYKCKNLELKAQKSSVIIVTGWLCDIDSSY